MLGMPLDFLPPPPATKQYCSTQAAQYRGLCNFIAPSGSFGMFGQLWLALRHRLSAIVEQLNDSTQVGLMCIQSLMPRRARRVPFRRVNVVCVILAGGQRHHWYVFIFGGFSSRLAESMYLCCTCCISLLYDRVSSHHPFATCIRPLHWIP